MRVIRGVHRELRGLLVKRISLDEQIGNGFARIRGLEEGPFGIARDPIENDLFVRSKPDHKTKLMQERDVFKTGDNAASGGDHAPGGVLQRFQREPFLIPKIRFAVGFENLRNFLSALLDD